MPYLVCSPGHPPEGRPRGGMPIFFERSAETAAAKAREMAGVTHLRYRVRS